MGIRFTCDACTKRLNVKAFLAGKRGICPHCGAKVDIPWASQAAGETAATAVPRSAAGARGAVGGNGSHSPIAAVPVAPSQPVAKTSASSNGHSNGATPMGVPVAQAAAAMPTATPVAAPSVPSAPSTPPAPADPIDEAPNAVWYVRPPSGGQYGPASGEIMRKWINEGRVSSDSLVWRDGWPDWQPANETFPQLGGLSAVAPAITPPQPGAAAFGETPSPLGASPAPAPSRPYTRRKNNNSLAMVLVIVLTLAAIGLLGIFFAVIAAW